MLSKNERRYLKWKKAYYEGNPIVSDDVFDTLERELEVGGSNVAFMVGYSTDVKKIRYAHPTRMLSLKKVPDLERCQKWKQKSDALFVTPKLDGMAANIIYNNGEFQLGISRGNGIMGIDITDKLRRFVPLKTSRKIYEIRGEIIIPLHIFDSKYRPKYNNARNFVAGQMNAKTVRSCLDEFHFVALEVKDHKGKYLPLKTLGAGFRVPEQIQLENNLKDIICHFKKYRYYKLDGIVLKYPLHQRQAAGETKKFPKWAVALKFASEQVKSTIIKIVYSKGHPVATIEPISIDGTIIRKVDLYSRTYVNKKKLEVGSDVIIVKVGNVIPKIL